MLGDKIKEKLKENWGDKADSLECYAEVRVFDPLSPWECFIYAMNPENEDEISCIVRGFEVEVMQWSLSELASRFNSNGDCVQLDYEYRPRKASHIYKMLNRG